VTGTGATFGTAFYMSPEQARGAGDVDPRADVWSLGVVLYELLTGKKPFDGGAFLEVIHKILSQEAPPLATLRGGLPPGLVALVEQAMTKDLAARLPSVVALAEGLAPYAGRGLITERSPPPSQAVAPTLPTPATGFGAPSAAPAPEPAPRRALIAGAVVVAIGVALAAYAGARRGHAPPGLPPLPLPVASKPASRPPAPVPPAETPTATGAPAPAPAPPAPTAPGEAAPPPAEPGARKRARTMSGQFERAPDRVAVPPAPAAPPSADQPPPAPKPAPAAGARKRNHAIEIERDNPYGP
jgi:serine/threonine-protein kinase